MKVLGRILEFGSLKYILFTVKLILLWGGKMLSLTSNRC